VYPSASGCSGNTPYSSGGNCVSSCPAGHAPDPSYDASTASTGFHFSVSGRFVYSEHDRACTADATTKMGASGQVSKSDLGTTSNQQSKMAVRCCKYTDNTYTTESNEGNSDGCKSKFNWQDAHDHCRSIEDVETGEFWDLCSDYGEKNAKGTGCGFDNYRVWMKDSCGGGQPCTQCTGGTPYAKMDSSGNGKTCVADCGTGQAPHELNECAFCDTFANYPYADHTAQKCVNQCPAGEAPDTNGDCTACPGGEFVGNQGGIQVCVSACPDGHAPDGNNVCQVCGGSTPYSETASGSTSCVSACATGEAPNTAGHCYACAPLVADKTQRPHKCASQCPAGHAPTSDECVACAGGTPYADQAAQTCVNACPNGEGVDDYGDCYTCPQMADQARTPPACVTVCPDGQAPDGNKNCADCPGGEYADKVNHACVATCQPGYAPNGATDTCIQCSATQTPFADMANTACVATCPAGQGPSVHGDCENCASGKYADHALNTCVTQCEPGHAPDGNNDCTKCGAGTFADHVAHACVSTCPGASAPNSQGSCEECTESLPWADPAANKCVSVCPEVQGPDTNNVCADCAGGTPYYLPTGCVADCGIGQAPDGSNVCAACQGPGTPFADHVAQQCVASCPQNYVPNDQKDCEFCSSYVDLLNSECMLECPRGPVRDGNPHMVGNAGVGNAYVGNANGLCVECTDPATPFADYAAGACVAACPAGSYPNHNWACRACGTLTTKAYSDLVHKRCVDTCPSGSIPDGNGDCAACNAGEYADHVAVSCVSSCPAGTQVDDVTGKDCKVVPAQFTPAERRQRELVEYALQLETRA